MNLFFVKNEFKISIIDKKRRYLGWKIERFIMKSMVSL